MSYCIVEKKTLKTITELKDLNINDKLVQEASQIPNIFNEHFATAGNRLASKLPLPQLNIILTLLVNVSLLSHLFFFNLLYRRK